MTADAPLIETSNASHADVLDAKTLETLPSVGRNVFLMAVTVPTVQSSGDTHWNRMQDQTGASTLSMGGGGVRANNYLLDGFPITDLQNRSSTNPSGEMVEDVRVQVHTYDAEMGRTGGGVFNTTARSGATSFRGSALLPDPAERADRPAFFNEIRGIETNDAVLALRRRRHRRSDRQRQDLLLGGRRRLPRRPVAERRHARPDARRCATATSRASPMRRDGQIIIYDPLTTDATATGSRSRQHHPANRINPVGPPTSQRASAADRATGYDNGTATCRRRTSSSRQGASRLAQARSPLQRQHLAERRVPVPELVEPDRNYFPDAPYAARAIHLDRAINVFVLNNTYILNPTTVATFRFGMNTFSDDNSLPFDFDPHDARLQPVVRQRDPGAEVPVGDAHRLQRYGPEGCPTSTYYSHAGVNGTLTKLAGAQLQGRRRLPHHRRRGAESPRPVGRQFTFNGQFTGSGNNPRPTAAMRSPTCCWATHRPERLAAEPVRRTTSSTTAWFVQDDWRVTDKLTVNYGVRLEHETGLAEADNSWWSASTERRQPAERHHSRRSGRRHAGAAGARRPDVRGPERRQRPRRRSAGVKASPRVGFAYSLNPRPWCAAATASSGRRGNRGEQTRPAIRRPPPCSRTRRRRSRRSTTRSRPA